MGDFFKGYKSYLVSIIILVLILTLKLKLSPRLTITIFLVSLIITLFPSIGMMHNIYYLPLVCLMVFFTIVTILIIPVNIRIKLLIIGALIIIYRKNYIFVTRIVSQCIKFKKIPNSDNNLRVEINKIFSNCFRMKNNFSYLPLYPTIIVLNYCRDRLENCACILIPGTVSIIMGDGCAKFGMHGVVDNPIYVKMESKKNFQEISRQIKVHHNKGRNIIAYVNKESYFGLGKYRTGIFKIAQQHNIPITPVTIDRIKIKYGTIPFQNFCIKIGNSFLIKDVRTAIRRTRKFHWETLREFKKNKFNPYYKV